MFSVRLVSADSYQAQPLPQLDPTFSEFRGSEIKHVPIVRVFGSLSTGEKTCLHIHGVFPYLYVPYTGEEDPASLAYRLAASLDAAINVSLGSASSSTQHVYLIQRVSGIPFYGYHKKEHQYLKIYFYNPAMIKRAADLLQNGSVLNRSLQPHEAHIPYVLQFMMDYNVYGMSMINLRGVKHRRITQSLAELGSSGQSGISENSEIDYLPSSVERQSTCELEMDALASDILNRREIERGLDLNPGLAAIWEEERARRAQAGLQGGDSQLVNPKSPPRPTFQPTENDLYQEQRLARRLLMISQCDESTLSTPLSRSVAYAAEVREGENLMNSSNISIPSVQKSQLVPRDDTVEDPSLLDSPTIVDSPKLSADCSVLGTDDQPLVDLLVDLAGGGVSENSESVDTDSVLGSQVSLLPSEPRSDNEDEDIPDLNLTSLQLDSLSDVANVRDPAEQRNLREDSSSTFHLSPFLTSREAASDSSRSADDSDAERNTKASRTQRMPQYDGAGDVSPTLANSSSDDENDSDNPKNAKEFSHLPRYNGVCEVASQSRRSETREQTTKSSSRSSAFFPSDQWDSACDRERIAERPRNADRGLVDAAPEAEGSRLSPSSALTSDAYLGQYTAISYEPFDRLLEIGPDFVPDLEGMHSSMEIGILLSSGDSDSPESVIQETDTDTIPLDAVLNGDPCFTESAELDKSDVTELRDQYASLLGNSLLPDVHTNPRIDDDLGSASNFSDSDYQGNEKNCGFSLNASSPRSAATSRDSSSSSENVTPNIQEPEARSGAKSKLGPGDAQEDCKEPRAPSDNSDYNCNLVATWAELQNIRQDKRLYRLRNRMTGQWIPGPRQSRRKADRRSLPNITTQLFGRVPETMQFQLAKSRHRSPRKVPLSSAGKSPVKKTKNASPPAPYILAESAIAASKIVEPVEEKLSTSDVARAPELEREETSEEGACQPLHTEASLAAFHRSIIGSDNPLAEGKKSPENLYSPEPFAEIESLVEPALPVFEELSEDVAEIVELPYQESDIFQGTSHYSSQRSEHHFSCGGFEHRHCKWSAKQRKIIQDQVFTSDQIYVIEKRKRGKQLPPDRSVCTKSFCKLPFVPLRKLEARTDGKIAGLEASKTEESLIRALPYRPNLDLAESPGAEPKIFLPDLSEKILGANADCLPKRRSRGRRRRAEACESIDSSSITSTLSSSDEEPRSFESSDWAENEGRWSVRRITSDDDARDPYNMRTVKKPFSSTRPRRNSRARDSAIGTRACRDLPGIPGIIDYPKKRGRQKKRDEETRVELPKPKKPLRSVLFPNWGAEREISESPNGATKMIPNGLAAGNRRASLSDRRKGRSLKTALSISPLPKNYGEEAANASKASGRKISPNVKQMPENEALNCMIREVNCPSTRAKLKLLIKSRRRSKLSTFGVERKLSVTGEERANETKIANAVIPTNSLVPSAIPRIGPTEASRRDADLLSDHDRISQDKKKRHPENAPEDPKTDKNRDPIVEPREAPTDEFEEARVENGGIVDPVEALDFETPALSVVFDASGDIFDTETEIVSKSRNCEESNDPKQISFRSDKYAISVTNFFTASNYTIDAVSLEIPTCLFEEDSNSVEQRMPRRIVQDGLQNGEDRRGDDAASSLDPRDLDVYDVESLTPSSSFSQHADANESSIDSSELSVSSCLDESTKSELSTESRHSRSGKTREGQGAACRETDEELSEEDSPEFEALSPRPKICEILGNSLEEHFDTDQSSRGENFEVDSSGSDNFARDESSRKGSVDDEADARLDEEIEDLVSHIVVRLEDEPELAEESNTRRFASGEMEVRLRKGEDGSYILPGAKNGVKDCMNIFEEKEIAASRNSWEDSARKENEAIVERGFSKEKEISSDERESEESMMSENNREGFAEIRISALSMEIEISSLEEERKQSRMSENDREALSGTRREEEALSIDILGKKENSTQNKKSEESMMSENDENIFPRAVNGIELVGISEEDKEAGITGCEEDQPLRTSTSETELPLINKKNEAVDAAIKSEKNFLTESRLMKSRKIEESIIARKEVLYDKEQRKVDQKKEQPIVVKKNVQALQIEQSEPEPRFINEKIEPVDAAIESENKLPIDSKTDPLPQLIASRKIVQSTITGKEEALSAATESETKPVDAVENSQPLITRIEISEPVAFEADANSPSITIENEKMLARTVNEIEPAKIGDEAATIDREEKESIAAEKNPEPPSITKSETELPLINEKYATLGAVIEVENELSIECENSREPLIVRAREKAGLVRSEDDTKSPSTAIREDPEPTIFSSDEDFLATVSSEEELEEVATIETVGKKYFSESRSTISRESMKNSSESNDSRRAESAGISRSNGLEGEIAKALQVDGNMNDAQTEQRESRLSSLSGDAPKFEERKESFKCRPVTIKLVSLDLSRISGFGLKSWSKSRVEEAKVLPEIEPSNVRVATLERLRKISDDVEKIPDEASSVQDGGRKIARSAKAKQVGRSQPKRKCVGKTKLERKLSEEKIQRECENSREEKISERTGEKISGCKDENTFEGPELSREVEEKEDRRKTACKTEGKTSSVSGTEEKIEERFALNGDENGGSEETIRSFQTSSIMSDDDTKSTEDDRSEITSEINFEKSSSESNSLPDDFGCEITDERSEGLFAGKTVDEKALSYARRVKAKGKINGRFACKKLRGRGRRAIKSGTRIIAWEISETSGEFLPINQENSAEGSKLGQSSSQTAWDENANAGTLRRSPENGELESTKPLSPKCDASPQKIEEKNRGLISSKSKGMERFGKLSEEHVGILDPEIEKKISREKCAINGSFGSKKLRGRTTDAIKSGTNKITRRISETFEFVAINQENSAQRSCDKDNFPTIDLSPEKAPLQCNSSRRETEENMTVIISKPKGMDRFGKCSGKHVQIFYPEGEKSREKCAEEIDGKMSGEKCAEEIDGKMSGEKCAEEIDEKTSQKQCVEEIEEKMSQELDSRSQETLEKLEARSMRSLGTKISEQAAQKPFPEESTEDIAANASQERKNIVKKIVETKAARGVRSGKNTTKEINITKKEINSRESNLSSLQSESDVESTILAKPRRRRSGKSSKANRQDPKEESQLPDEESISTELSSQTFADEMIEQKIPIKPEKKNRARKTPLTSVGIRYAENSSSQDESSKCIAEENSQGSTASSQQNLVDNEKIPIKSEKKNRTRKTPLTSAGLRCSENPSSQEETSKPIAEEISQSEPWSQQSSLESEERTPSKPRKRSRPRKDSIESARNLSPEYPLSQEEDEPIKPTSSAKHKKISRARKKLMGEVEEPTPKYSSSQEEDITDSLWAKTFAKLRGRGRGRGRGRSSVNVQKRSMGTSSSRTERWPDDEENALEKSELSARENVVEALEGKTRGRGRKNAPVAKILPSLEALSSREEINWNNIESISREPEVSSRGSIDERLELKSPAKLKRKGRVCKSSVVDVKTRSLENAESQEESDRERTEKPFREPEVPSWRIIDEDVEAKSPVELKRTGRPRKSSAVDAKTPLPESQSSQEESDQDSTENNSRVALEIKKKRRSRKSTAIDTTRFLDTASSQEESDRDTTERPFRKPEEISSQKRIDEDIEVKSSVELKKKRRGRKSSAVDTKTPPPETPSSQEESDRDSMENSSQELGVSQKITDEETEPKSSVELKKKRRGRKILAVDIKTPPSETPSSQEKSVRDSMENSSQEPEVPQKITDEETEPKSSVELKKKRRGRKSSAADNKTPSLEIASSPEESHRDATENSSKEPEVAQKITDEKTEPKGPVKPTRKGCGRKNSATNKKPSLEMPSLQEEGRRDVTENVSQELDFPFPELSLSIMTVIEKTETKNSIKVEKKNRARKSQEANGRESSPNHSPLPEENRHETTVTKSPETPAASPKLAKDKIATKTSITSKKRAHISYSEVDDLESLLSESVPEVANPPLESSPLPPQNSSEKSKPIIDRNSLPKPKKKIRFDEASIRRSTSILRLTDSPPKETAVEEPSSKKHQRLPPNSKLTEANFTGEDDKRSNNVSDTDWNSSKAEIHQTGNTSNPSDRKLVDGVNGLRENKKLQFNFSDNVSLDLSSLQKASGKLSEPSRKPKTRETYRDANSLPTGVKWSAPMEKSLASTTKNPKRSRDCVQLRRPIVVLKRLSRDSLRSHGYAFRSKAKKFVKNLKKSDIDDFRLPAYDGAADLTSSDSDEEADLTIASDEKRVCIYQSDKKPAASRRDSIATPKKRKLDDADDDLAGPSSKRRARATPAKTPKKSSHRSPSRTSMLRSPGRLSGYYSPLKIIVTSPKVRKETSESRETVRPDNRDASVSSSGSVTPGRKRERLHESMMRGRISVTKSSGMELGGKHEFAATMMASERSGELDGIASVGHEERGSVKTAAGTISNEPADATAIARDSRDVRKRLVFFSTGEKSDAAKSNEPKGESRKLKVSSEDSRDFAMINETEEPIELPDNLADRRSTMSVAEPLRTGCAPKLGDRDPYDVTTDEESADDDEAFDVRLSQYVDSRMKDERVVRPKFDPSSSRSVPEAIETRATPKHRDKEPIELSDNLADPESNISVAEPGTSRSAQKFNDRDSCNVANDDEALDFTFSQYGSRMSENRALLDRSALDSPSSLSVKEAMETCGRSEHRDEEPIELSDNLPDRKSTIFVSEPGTSSAAPKFDDRDSCGLANDDVFDVTFSQYIDSRLSENRALLDRSRVDADSNNERVVLRPKFDPPSRRSVVETMETYGIARHRNQEPFFSVDADVPRQKELAHRMLKVPGKSLKDVPAFVSSVDGVTGIARWRKMKITEFIPSLTRSNDVEVKIALCSNDKVVLTPLARPPTRKEAKDWLRAREYLKKKKDEEESRRRKLEEKEKIDARAAETEDECSSNASDLSAAEPSPESAGGKSEQERAPNRGLNMRLAKRGLLKKVEEATGRKTRHGSEEEIEVDSRRESGSRKGSGDSNSTEMDPSLLSVLGKSRLFREQEASRHLGVSCGQIEFLSDSTRSNVDNENLQNAKALTRYQYLTIMCLEVHVTTRGDLLPDAQYDSIVAIFYSVQSDVPPTSTIKPLEHGVIVVAETDKAKNKMYYSYASKFPWSVSFAQNEEALLNSLVNLITRVDPEILIGWELETLSWGYVFQRASIMGMNLYKRISRIPATQGKWEAQPRDIETLAEVKLPGRIVLDIWRIMRHEAALLSYTFESMMHHVLNERIPCPSFKTLTDWWNLEKPRPSRWRVVEHYSIRTLGVFRILDQLDIIGRTSELARLFGIQFFEVFSRGSQYRVESVMLRLAKPLNYIAVSPSAQQRASMRAMEALPLIMEPESMFYSDPLIVLDFQSLYPSIIIAHNYCFSTCLGRIEHIGQPEPFEFGAYTLRVPKSTSLKLQGKVNFAPCGVAFVKPEVCLGVLPRMLTEILETRFMVKKAMKDHKRDDKTLQRALHSRQMGLKFLANVTYGYTAANFSGRMPCIEVGDSVVSKSKETLERAIKLVESTPKWGARVVYGDTDSLFILVPGKSKADAFVIGNEIADAVTAANPPPIKLKFEKVVYPGILQTKKRYCGYMYETPEQENPTYLAKGIETVRRDGCPAVSKILEKTLKILFETKDVSLVKKYVTRQLDKVLRGKVSIQDLTFAKEFRGLKGYKAKACVPALELTKRLMKKDPRAVPRNSERVRYVIVAGAPNQALIHCVRTPWELINDPGLRPNGIYYVTRVIVPPLNRCLNLMGVDVNAWYREMPHRHILDNPVGQPVDRQKLTIFQYFGTIVCAVCGQSSNKGICTECAANPPDALVVLHDKLRRLDRTDSHVTAICQSCVGQADVADCASLDCPVLYRRAQAQRELTQATHLRTIIECGNKLEL